MPKILLVIMMAAIPAALVTSVCWLLFRRFSETTKGAWAMAIAFGYAVGHIGYISVVGLPSDLGTGELVSTWASQFGPNLQHVLWPRDVIDCLPLGVLLAGLVSANSALFPFQRQITFIGALLVSFWLGLQLIGGIAAMKGQWLTSDFGLRLVLGTVAMVLCWMSLQNSIQGKSRKVWMASVSILTLSVVGVLAIVGQEQLAILSLVLLAAMGGGLMASLLRSAGTDNIRFSGAVISFTSISLLLAAWWLFGMIWYPVVLLVIGFIAVNSWLPAFLRGTKQRVSITLACSVGALTISALVRFGML